MDENLLRLQKLIARCLVCKTKLSLSEIQALRNRCEKHKREYEKKHFKNVEDYLKNLRGYLE